MSNDIIFTEKTIASEEVFSGNLLKVFKDDVRLPSGRSSSREYIKHPGAAVAIPYLGNNDIIMVKQFRYPVKKVMLELPAGKIDAGELPEAAIQREMAEEIGYRSRTLKHVCRIHTCVGYSDEILQLFWACDLQNDPQTSDDDETIEIVSIAAEKAIALMLKGQITDAKSLIGLFWLKEILHTPALRDIYLP